MQPADCPIHLSSRTITWHHLELFKPVWAYTFQRSYDNIKKPLNDSNAKKEKQKTNTQKLPVLSILPSLFLLNPGTLPPSLKPSPSSPLGIRPTQPVKWSAVSCAPGWDGSDDMLSMRSARIDPRTSWRMKVQPPPTPPREKDKNKTLGRKKVWFVCVCVCLFEQFPKSKCWFGCSCDYYICSMILPGSEHIYDPKGERRQDGGCGLWLSQPVYASLG